MALEKQVITLQGDIHRQQETLEATKKQAAKSWKRQLMCLSFQKEDQVKIMAAMGIETQLTEALEEAERLVAEEELAPVATDLDERG